MPADSPDGTAAVWICASCGARHDANDQPCSECASEQFARLDDTGPDRVTGVAHVEFECADCGRRHNRNNPPCKKCGGMNFRTIRGADLDEAAIEGQDSVVDDVEAGVKRITGTTVVAYLTGATLFLLAIGYTRFPIAAAAFIAGGLVATPVTRRWIGSRAGVEFSTGAILLLVTIAGVVAIAALI